MVEFRLLGTLSLTTADGREAGSLLSQPRRLALLAYLAAATPRGPHRRDTLLALFWPELDQEHARAALRQSLHVLRTALGADTLVSRGDEEIGLDFERIWCDVAAFARAIDGGEPRQALDFYRGNLMAGFFISDAPEFERWLESERAKLAGVAARTARTLAQSCEKRGDLSTAVLWARRAIELSQISGLRVLARSAVRRYADTSAGSADIARDLGVGTVLEGTVGRQGERLRIHLELIDSRTRESLWSDTYDEGLQDVLAVQREVARRVADKLQVRLLATEQAQLGRRMTPNANAYDFYLRGLYESHQESRVATDSAIGLLERTTTADPQFALGYSALAYAYTEKLFDYDSNRQWEERAYVAIQKALALDPELADAYLARGKLTWTLANHFPHARAIQDMKRALALNPNLATARYWLGGIYLHIGLLDKALQELRLAVSLDPSDLEAPPRIARVHWYEQQFDTALVEFERMAGWEDEHALVLDHLGRTDEALRLLQQAEGRGPREPADIASARAVILARHGPRARVAQQIAIAVARGSGRSHFHHAEYNIATAYALQGDHARALAWLHRTAEDGLPCYPLFAGDPYLDSLRRDPEFVAFLGRLKAQWENYKATL